MINWLRKIRFLTLYKIGWEQVNLFGEYYTSLFYPSRQWNGWMFEDIDKTGIIPQGWEIDLPWGHNDRGDHYTTYLHSISKGQWFGYGSYEICYRAEIENMKSRPAFWLLNLETLTCEIDITEHFRADKKYDKFQVAYWYHYEPRKGWRMAIRSKKLMKEMENKFFAYRLDWRPNKLVWYINGLKIAVYKVYIPVDKMAIVISGIRGHNIKWLKFQPLT